MLKNFIILFVKLSFFITLSCSQSEPKIISGHPCSIKHHPYVVQIRQTQTFRHRCAGSLIGPYWVLTAAHCCIPNYRRGMFTVIAGLSERLSNSHDNKGLQSSLVYKCYQHRNFSAFTHGIGLMELDYFISESFYVRYATLATFSDVSQEQLLEVCKNATVLGWGMSSALYVSSHSTHLQCIELPLISVKECDYRFNRLLPEDVLCTYHEKIDSCQGDLGGPLECRGIQYGVVSTGMGCATGWYLGLFIRVDRYEDYINEMISFGPRNLENWLIILFMVACLRFS